MGERIDAFIFYTHLIYCRVTRDMFAHKSSKLLRIFSGVLCAAHSEASDSNQGRVVVKRPL